jgi:peptidoglycan/xylan/chitin deacetylase (PgdA/CDA1 family)
MRRTGRLVAHPNPIDAGDSDVGVTTLRWTSTGTGQVEIRVGRPEGPLFSRGGPEGEAVTGPWVTDGLTFFLQDTSSELAPPEATLARVTVTLSRAGRAVVLLYHRVADVTPDVWSLAVTPTHFSEHLEVLRRDGYRLVGLEELQRRLDAAEPLDRAVVVTFDDGYADNLYRARPCLERADVPATVFVTSGYVDGRREFWWDALDHLLTADALPETIELVVDDSRHRFPLETSAATAAAGDRSWRAQDPPSTPRQRAYSGIYALLKALAPERRERALTELWQATGVVAAPRPSHRQLTSSELIRLAEGHLVTIGSHTVSHPKLSMLSLERQRAEIEASKAALEQVLAQPVRSFAYPHGDYANETARLVQAAGHSCACSTAAGPVTRQSDRYALPRVMVEDWDGEAFARWLGTQFGAHP